MNKYHSMGSLVSKIRLGVIEEKTNNLLASTCFNVPRYNSAYEYEIGRYAVKFGFNVRGNFSKMMKFFLKKYDPKSILTYHDNLLRSEIHATNKMGLKRWKTAQKDFFGFLIMKFKIEGGLWKGMLPKKLGEKFDPSISAHQNLRNHGYVKIWDIGQSKFEWIQKIDEDETNERNKGNKMNKEIQEINKEIKYGRL